MCDFTAEIIRRLDEVSGFEVLPRRCVVERMARHRIHHANDLTYCKAPVMSRAFRLDDALVEACPRQLEAPRRAGGDDPSCHGSNLFRRLAP